MIVVRIPKLLVFVSIFVLLTDAKSWATAHKALFRWQQDDAQRSQSQSVIANVSNLIPWKASARLSWTPIPEKIPDYQFMFRGSGLDKAKRGTQLVVDQNERCIQDIETTVKAFERREEWALQMYDAMGKVGSGTTDRRMRSWGDYYQCMRVDTNHTFHTTHCMAYLLVWKMGPFNWTKPKLLELGLCVPTSCDNTTVSNMVNLYLFKQANVSAVAVSSKCQKRHLDMTPGAIAAIVLNSTIALLMLLATIYDLRGVRRWEVKHPVCTEGMNGDSKWSPNTRTGGNTDTDPILIMARRKRSQSGPGHVGKAGQILLSFSMIQNGSKLLSFASRQSDLHCINGIRVLSMTCIIWGHTMSNVFKPATNGHEELDRTKSHVTIETTLAYMSVDTFFVLSGMLLVYSIMPRLKVKGVSVRFLANVYVMRYLRLTPPYLLVIVIYTQLFRYMAEGPIWPQEGLDLGKCYQFPWNNFLYINNFYDIDGPNCMDWSWYLAVDMQFFVIFPIVLLPLYFFDWKGLCVPIILSVASAVTAGIISYNNKLLPIIIPTDSLEQFMDYMKLYYLMPYTRYGPYAAGMVLGYVLEKYKCRAILPKSVVATGWILSSATILAVLLSAYFHELYGLMNNEVAAVYNAVNRPLWGLAVSWIIFACCTGYGGLVNTILSFKIFGPFGRLTYMVYLIHLIIINFVIFSLQTPIYVDEHRSILFYFSGFFVLCFSLAFFLCMAYEAPIVNLMRIIRQRKGKNLQSIEESRL